MRSRLSDATGEAVAPAVAFASPPRPRKPYRVYSQIWLTLAVLFGMMLGIGVMWLARRSPLPLRGSTPLRASAPHWLTRLDALMAPRRSAVFRAIAATDAWNNPSAPLEERATVAGPGSSIAYTEPIREWLGRVIAEREIQTMADLSCSEMLWQPLIPGWGGLQAFSGYDIVPEVVNRARVRAMEAVGFDMVDQGGSLRSVHGAVRGVRRRSVEGRHGPALSFAVADLASAVEPLGKFDLVLVRDTLMHLPLTDALRTLERIDASGSKWLVTTTFDTGEQNRRNEFIAPGDWQPINLEIPPFEIGQPESWVNEGTPGVDFFGIKRLALWRLPVLRMPSGQHLLNGTEAMR